MKLKENKNNFAYLLMLNIDKGKIKLKETLAIKRTILKVFNLENRSFFVCGGFNMSEELHQRDLINDPEKIGKYSFYNIGATTLNQLKNAGIIKNKDYGKFEKRKPDGLIVKNKIVIAVIENKSPEEYNSNNKKRSANNQALEIAKVLGAKLIISTDTFESVWINALRNESILDERGNEIKVVFRPKEEKQMEAILDKILNSISRNNSRIVPLEYTDPTPLAKQVWQITYQASAATPENCLYTFIEIFIFKYLSDLEVLQGMYSFEKVLDMYKDNGEEDVLEYYAKNVRPYIKKLFPASTDDNTTIINGTIFVNESDEAIKGFGSVFKQILLKFSNFGKLENIDFDFKSKIFEIFFKEDNKKSGMGQYFTPLKVVQQIVNMVDIKEGMVISDPASGVGKFILEAVSKNIDEFYKIEKNKLSSKIKIEGFDKGFTKDNERTIILAKANMMIYFSELIKQNRDLTKEFSNLFNNTFHLKTSVLGTLEEPVKERYDLILTNPPYVVKGVSTLKEIIKKDTILSSYYTKNGNGVEGLFIEWIVRALKKNGKAIIVVPDGIFNRKNDLKLREFILEECFVDAIISLPTKTFFTTPKKTFILALTKKKEKNIKQKDDVFTYLVSNIGETLDTNRFDIDENDLEEAVYLYHIYNADKSKYKNTDPRCKLIPIQTFYEKVEEHWIIDKFWTEKEKIDLGILEEDNILSIEEFSEVIKSISDELSIYEEELKGLLNDEL